MATAQNDSLLKNTRSMLRSVLLSAPRGVRARNLEGEYRGITGKSIPYRELGYKSLKDFMNTLQDVARLSTAEGEPVYYGVADSSTAHIAKMVAKQKKPKKKSQPLFSPASRKSRGGGHYKGQSRQQYSQYSHSSYHKDYSRAKTASRTVSQVASQPERTVQIVDVSKTVTSPGGGGGAYATKSWKDTAVKVDVMGYVTNMELKNIELVQLSGYIQSTPEEHSYKGMQLLRTLLCSSPELVVGKGQSVMCHFLFSDWNYQQHQGPWSLKRGQRVTFYGKPWARSSAKVKESMALKVLYYDIGDTATTAAKKNTSDTSKKSDAQSSPKKATVARPASNDAELEERLYEIVKESTAGLYYDRAKVLYQKKYGHEISDEKVAMMKSLRIEEPVSTVKIIYPVRPPSKETAQPVVDPDEKPQQLITPQAHSTDSAVAMATLVDEVVPPNLPKAGERLKILVTHVEEGPRLFYAQICNDETIRGLQCLDSMTVAINKNGELLSGSSVGQYCAALYKDNSWNRAVITETKLIKGPSKGSKLKSHVIQYVDYGSTASVPTTELRKLPIDYWKIPIQAIPCTLSLDEDGEYADSGTIHKHFNKLTIDKFFIVNVKFVNNEDILVVDMFQEDNTCMASLLQELLSQEKPSLPEYAQPSYDSDEEICYMDVFVTLVESPASFYIQLIGEDYSDKLIALETDLEKYVTNNKLVMVKSFEVNSLILYIDDDHSNLRALLLSVDSSDHVRIQLVDYGHTMTVSKDKLFILPNKFWKLPFQVGHIVTANGINPLQGRQCFLYECADFVDTQPVTEEFTALAEEQQLGALIVDSSSSRLAVQLITGDDVIINDLLKNKYCPLSELLPRLPEGGKVTRGILTNINCEGLLTLQLAGIGATKLKEIEQKINSIYNTKASSGSKFVKKMSVGLQCVAKCNDNKYYRAEVTKTLSATEVEVNLVDYGKLITIDKLKIRTLDDASIWSLPYQAVTCSLDNLPPPKGSWTEQATNYLKEKCCNEVTVEGTGTMGSVKLYLQNSDDEEDLNETLQSSPHLFGLSHEDKIDKPDDSSQTSNGCHSDNKSNDQLNINRNSNVLCYQPLPPSDCEDDGATTIECSIALQPDTFQVVKVTHVQKANDEFMVQLLSNEQLIEKLTEELQAYCNSTPSSVSDINDLPHYCAVRHNGVWYRAKLLDTKGQDILVTLLDYGANVVTNTNSLHHLHHTMVAIPKLAVSCLHYLSLKEGTVRPSAIIPGNLYHCFPYFRSKQCYVVSLVDYETKTILQSST